MPQQVELVQVLLRARRWLDVRAMESTLLCQTGEALAVAHAQLHMAYVGSASCPEDWRRARQHVYVVLDLAPKSSPTYLWALQAAAAVNVNLRRPREATVFARAFLREAVRRGDLRHLVPFAWQNLGAAATLLGQHKRAAQCHRTAMSGLGPGYEEERERVRIYLAWSLLRAGHIAQAAATLPPQPIPGLQSIWHASRAYLAVAQSEWERAATEATEALHRPWSPIDAVEATEMCLLLAEAGLRRKERAAAIAWAKRATELAVRQGRAICTRLVLATAAEGGDFLAAVASRGSGGYHPDACLSTGVGG